MYSMCPARSATTTISRVCSTAAVTRRSVACSRKPSVMSSPKLTVRAAPPSPLLTTELRQAKVRSMPSRRITGFSK
jgi:hypothetical protein